MSAAEQQGSRRSKPAGGRTAASAAPGRPGARSGASGSVAWRSAQAAEVISRLAGRVSRRRDRAPLRQRVGTARFGDTLRPEHRRHGEQGDGRAVPEIPYAGRLCGRRLRPSSKPISGPPASSGTRRNTSWGRPQKLLSEFDGKVPHSMAELLTLPGVARKTANIVLGNADSRRLRRRPRRRDRRRHSRASIEQPLGTRADQGRSEDRNRTPGRGAPRGLVSHHLPAHRARAGSVHRA